MMPTEWKIITRQFIQSIFMRRIIFSDLLQTLWTILKITIYNVFSDTEQ